MSTIETLNKIAKAEVGNGGSKYRKWFYNRESDYYGVHWCAVWVSWLFNQIDGLGKYIVKSDGAGSIARLSVAKGLGTWYESEYSCSSTTPKPGDIVEFTWNGMGKVSGQDKYYSNHVGYVYAVDANNIYTFEGNTGNNNPDLTKVKMKSYYRKSGCINGYFRPNYDEGDDEMNFKKGDKSDGVLTLKALLQHAKALGIITSNCDDTNSFGNGTYKAVIEIQRKYNLEVDGIAGVKTITALREGIKNAIESGCKNLTSVNRNIVLDEAIKSIEKLKR